MANPSAKQSEEKMGKHEQNQREQNQNGSRNGQKQEEEKKVRVSKRMLAGLMKEMDFCMMTTVDAHGRLCSRPMSNNRDVSFDGDSWFFAFADSQQAQQIEANPAVNLAYSQPDEILFISLVGTGEIVRDDRKKKKLWHKELERWFVNGPEDDSVILIKVSAQHATYWGKDGEGEADL